MAWTHKDLSTLFENTASGLVVKVPVRREDQGNNDQQCSPPPASCSYLQLSTVNDPCPPRHSYLCKPHGTSLQYHLTSGNREYKLMIKSFCSPRSESSWIFPDFLCFVNRCWKDWPAELWSMILLRVFCCFRESLPSFLHGQQNDHSSEAETRYLCKFDHFFCFFLESFGPHTIRWVI